MDQVSLQNGSADSTIKESAQVFLRGLINNKEAAMVEHIVDVWINSFLAFAGIISNILQLIVFFRMGFQETINISMTFISSWDLFRSIAGAIYRLYGFVHLFSPTLAVSWYNVTLVVFSYTSGCGMVASGVLAGYVAVERCICVTFPFAVRYLLTHRVVIVINTSISIVVFSTLVLQTLFVSLVETFSPQFNETILVVQFNPIWLQHPQLDNFISSMFIVWVFVSFVAICMSSAIIKFQLGKASAFRRENKSAESKTHTSREHQVTKMLLVIISVYIICGLPRIVYFIVKGLVPDFAFGRRYHNTFWVTLNVVNTLDFANAGVNIFIFYNMSSHFKSVFLKTFRAANEQE